MYQEHTERAAPEEAIGKVELSNLEQSNTAVAVADHKVRSLTPHPLHKTQNPIQIRTDSPHRLVYFYP